jgi:hypothetical protein
MARMVVVEPTGTAAEYRCEFVVGVVPSVV